MARQGKARQGKNRRSQAKPKESRRRMRRRTVTRLRENGRRAAMTNEAGLTGGPGAGRNGRRRERKSTIVAEGTRRPSVASTCCASRLHFTPLSSLPILSLPPFFFIFLPFSFFKFVLSHPSPEEKKTLRRSIRPLSIPGLFSAASFLYTSHKFPCRILHLHHFYRSGNEIRLLYLSHRAVFYSLILHSNVTTFAI